jgi:hypothetical protein
MQALIFIICLLALVCMFAGSYCAYDNTNANDR